MQTIKFVYKLSKCGRFNFVFPWTFFIPTKYTKMYKLFIYKKSNDVFIWKNNANLEKLMYLTWFFFIFIVHCVHRAFVDAGLFLVTNKKRWHELKTPRYRITFNMGKFQNKMIFVNLNGSLIKILFTFILITMVFFSSILWGKEEEKIPSVLVKKRKKSVKNHD